MEVVSMRDWESELCEHEMRVQSRVDSRVDSSLREQSSGLLEELFGIFGVVVRWLLGP
jgi:hypothetical protein